LAGQVGPCCHVDPLQPVPLESGLQPHHLGRRAWRGYGLQRAADLGETSPSCMSTSGRREEARGPLGGRRATERALIIDPYYAPAPTGWRTWAPDPKIGSSWWGPPLPEPTKTYRESVNPTLEQPTTLPVKATNERGQAGPARTRPSCRRTRPGGGHPGSRQGSSRRRRQLLQAKRDPPPSGVPILDHLTAASSRPLSTSSVRSDVIPRDSEM